MIINWFATKAQQLFLVQDTEPDELSEDFDFALSAEMMALLYAKNVLQQRNYTITKDAFSQFALDEHELALT
jgi:hypothetical protein